MTITRKIKNGINIIKKQGAAALLNKAMIKYTRARMPDYCITQPVFAQVEVTTYCNLRCSSCREFLDDSGPEKFISKHLTLEQFKKIISSLPHLRGIRLNGTGEPLMHPDLIEIIRFVSDIGIKAHFISNGTLLKGNIAERLLKSGIDKIFVSVDGASAGVFEDIRKGAKMEEVVDNIKNFAQMLKESWPDSPQFIIITTVSKKNFREVPEIVELVHSLGIKNLLLKRMFAWTEALRDDVVSHEECLIIKKAREIAERLDITLSVEKLLESQTVLSSKDSDRPMAHQCKWPWSDTYISVDGWITPCCNIFDPKKINFGNIFRDDFRAIWNCADMREFRKKLKNSLPDVCYDACSL